MKVGVLGLGSIGQRHLTNLKSMGVDVLGYDPIERNATNPPPSVIRKNFIDDSGAIVIATPSQHHLKDIEDSLLAGKHIFVEKPVVTDIKNNIVALIEKAKNENRVFFVGNNLRYHSCVRAAKEALLMGKIGKPLWASVTVGQLTTKEPYLRDGVTLNWGAHEVDLALYLLGPAEVKTTCVDSADSFADFVLLHDNGCRSIVHLDYVTNPEIRATTIVGDKGQLVIDLVARWCCLITQDGKHEQFTATDSWDSNYIDEMKGFLARCSGHNDGIGATGEDGLAALKIIEAVKEKAKA